jgi:hypothetical protein
MNIMTGFTYIPNTIYNFLNNESIFIVIVIVIIIYAIIYFGLGKSVNNKSSIDNDSDNFTDIGIDSSSVKSISKYIFFTILIIFLLLFIIFIFHHMSPNVLNYSVFTNLSDFFTSNPKIDIVVEEGPVGKSGPIVPEIKAYKQVFNIPGNYYNYSDAQTLCQAYGSRLADYSEIENAYGKGAEWCNYGWSQDQMALFPTQAETYKNLQKIPGHEHDCGRPGVNGGYIANPNVRFGVNCFGYKPEMTAVEEELMENTTPYPLTEKDIMMEKKVEYWKKKLPDILVSPFNYNNWTKI